VPGAGRRWPADVADVLTPGRIGSRSDGAFTTHRSLAQSGTVATTTRLVSSSR
jgi:hypothetical protein